MEYRRLGKTNLKVSILGFGASSLGSVFREIDESEGIKATHLALDMGINFIDVSPFYGLTKAETVLGKALKGIPRDRYILATKVGRYGFKMKDFDFSAERVSASVDESLRRLGVDYVDLIQCHDIEFGSLDQVINETIPALRKIQERGKARFVGITGLPLKIFTTVLEKTEVDTILSYCHYSLNDTSLERIIPYLKSRDVGIISASPLSMGLLTRKGPPAWHPAPDNVREVCAKAAEYCEQRGANLSKLAIQFSVINPDIHTTLVSTANPKHIEDNIKWLDEPIDEELLNEVLRILAPIKDVTWESGRPENN